MINCAICQRAFRALNRHTAVHGMTLDEYRQRFPGVATIDDDVRFRMSSGGRIGSRAIVPQRTKGYQPTQEAIQKRAASLRGHGCTPETRTKISEAQKGKQLTEEHRKNLSLSHQGKPGRVRTHEEIKRAVDTRTRNGTWNYGPQPPEWIARRIANRAGYRHSQETIQKIRVSNTGKIHAPMSLEGRRKLSLSGARNIQKWKKRIEHLDRLGRLWKFRSSWERLFAEHLDRLGLTWSYEPCILLLSDGRHYVPDFWVEDWKTYVEIKGWSGWRTDKIGIAQQDGHPLQLVEGRKALDAVLSATHL